MPREEIVEGAGRVSERPRSAHDSHPPTVDPARIWKRAAEATLDPLTCVARTRGLRVYAPRRSPDWGVSFHDTSREIVDEEFGREPPEELEDLPESWERYFVGMSWDWGLAPVSSLHLVTLIDGPGSEAGPIFLEAFNDDIREHQLLGAVVPTAGQRNRERWLTRAVPWAIHELGLGVEFECGPIGLPFSVTNQAPELIREPWLKDYVAGWLVDDEDWGGLLRRVISEERGDDPYTRFRRWLSRVSDLDLDGLEELAREDRRRLEEFGEQLLPRTRQVLFDTYWSGAYETW